MSSRKVIQQIVQQWKQYKYRFVPWIAFNLKNRSVRNVNQAAEDKVIPCEEVERQLFLVFSAFYQSYLKDITKGHTTPSTSEGSASSVTTKDVPENCPDCKIQQSVPPVYTKHNIKSASDRNLKVLHDKTGFMIQRKASTLKGGGTGVCVTRGTVPKHTVVALYPGTLYQPFEPILLQSLGNPFIFRCIDRLLIDGNDKGISRFLFRSCAQRDRVGPYLTCDMTWLTDTPVNPLAVGQYVNNQSKEFPANVAYQEFDVPEDFPFHLLPYLPHIFYTPSSQSQTLRCIRTVVLVSLRDIHEGEELFSSYFTVVH